MNAGSGSEFSGCAGKFRCILERRVQKRFVSIANRAQMENSQAAVRLYRHRFASRQMDFDEGQTSLPLQQSIAALVMLAGLCGSSFAKDAITIQSIIATHTKQDCEILNAMLEGGSYL